MTETAGTVARWWPGAGERRSRSRTFVIGLLLMLLVFGRYGAVFAFVRSAVGDRRVPGCRGTRQHGSAAICQARAPASPAMVPRRRRSRWSRTGRADAMLTGVPGPTSSSGGTTSPPACAS
ncbi:hypothetical protein HBB16_03195 [Pseudonocardia sp. MCCB 268]|nr:hypothetical protein [Pseudonocardia cytotoxica]